MFHERVCSFHYLPGRPIVAFQLENLYVVELLLVVQDVVDARSPERIDALVVVAHHANALVLGCQEFHDSHLHEVRVLVFVYQNILEALGILVANVGIFVEKAERVHQQIIEIHGVCLPATSLIGSIDLRNGFQFCLF